MRFFRASTKEIFFAAFGVVTLLFQIPLTKMILDDPESLSLGTWNWTALALFCFLTFLLIPALFGLCLWVASGISRRGAVLLLAATSAFFFSMQVNYHILQFYFMEAAWRKSALMGMFLVLTAAMGIFQEGTLRLLKRCALFGPVMLVVFAMQAAPTLGGKKHPLPPAALQLQSEANVPVFFLTFEKIVSSFVADEKGQISKERLPNLAHFVSESDYYPQAYSNSTATIYSLKTLYTGRHVTRDRNWTRYPNLRDIVGVNRPVCMQLDLLTNYCNPKSNICLRSIGQSTRGGFDLIMGWYKTYFLVILPDSLEARLTLLGWHFNPWWDMWAREESQLKPGENLMYRVGSRQFEILKQAIQAQGQAPALYIMHNFISDGVSVKASSPKASSRAEYLRQVEKGRQNLAAFDREIGLFFDFLKERGLYDRSLIIITADTGCDGGLRYLRGETELPAVPEMSHVFFALKRSGQAQGRVFHSVLRQVDVLPTLLVHLGVDPQPYHFEGVPVTDPDATATLAQHPLDFFVAPERFSILRYRLTDPHGPYRRVK